MSVDPSVPSRRPRRRRATAVVVSLLAVAGGALASTSASFADLVSHEGNRLSDAPAEAPDGIVDLGGGRSGWPLAGPDGEAIRDAEGRVAVLDPDAADAVTSRRSAAKPETRLTEDGVVEDVYTADPIPYHEQLDALEDAGALVYVDENSSRLDAFCAEFDDAACEDSGR